MTDDATLYARMLGGMEAFFGLAGDTSPGGFTIRRAGVLPSVCPEMPHRSVFNSVVYRSTPRLEAALDELADARRRGCATTSLQATGMGRPIYARLGYRELDVIEMWERRRGRRQAGT